MSLAQLLAAHYTNQNRGKNHRQLVLPQGAAGGVLCCGATALVGGARTYGVWVDVATQAQITTDTLVVGVVLDSFDTDNDDGIQADIYTIDIGCTLSVDANGNPYNYDDAATINALAAAIIAAAHRAEVRYEAVTAVGVLQPVMLEYPILIPSGVGILARVYDVNDAGGTGDHDQVNVSVILVQQFEGRMA